MIEKKILIFGLFVLFLLPASALAAGDDSTPESTIVFRETLPDNIMFYPDNETHGTGYADDFNDVSDWTTTAGTISISTDGDVMSHEADSWQHSYTNDISLASMEGYWLEYRLRANVTHYVGDGRAYGYHSDDRGGGIAFYDNVAWLTSWQTFKTYIPNSAGYGAGVLECVTFTSDKNDCKLEVDYLRIGKSTEMGWQHDGSTTAGVSSLPLIYEEDMSDVSDWNAINDPITTDGDVANLTSSDDYTWDRYDCNTPTGAYWTDYKVKIRWKSNITGSSAQLLFVTKAADDYGEPAIHSEYAVNGPSTTDWTITIFTHDESVGHHEVECLSLIVRASANVMFQIDYVDIGKQVSDTGTVSSDGDELTLTADADGSIFAIQVDTTATAATLNTDYYPMLALDFNDADSADYVMAESYDGSDYATVIANTTIGTDTLRANLHAVDDDIEAFWLSVNPSAVVRLKWTKAYSIANFTVTQSSAGTDDYLYVDDGVLYSNIDSGYIELDHNPTLSVVPDTYPLYYNLITIGIAPEFAMYVSSWSTYSEETRGIISSRIVTDIKLKFDSTEIISEIKFAMDDISIFDELFLSLDMWGYFGPLGLVVIGYLLTKKEKPLGIFMFIVDCLVISHYLTLVDAMPDYWWHIYILLLGVILCIVQMTKQ